MKDIFAITSLVVSLAANVPYIVETIQGKVKPERISWLIWTVLAGVYFSSTIFDTGAVLYTLGETIGTIAIFILALKYGVGGRSRFDLISLGVATVALGLLFVLDGVLISLCIALFVDAIASLLTIRKLKIDPSSESRGFWVLAGLASLLALFSLNSYTLVAILFPLYVLLLSAYIWLNIQPKAKHHTKELEEL